MRDNRVHERTTIEHCRCIQFEIIAINRESTIQHFLVQRFIHIRNHSRFTIAMIYHTIIMCAK